MRRLALVLLLVAAPALAWPATGKPKRVVIPPASLAPLRGPQDAAPAPLAKASRLAISVPPIAFLDGDGGKCRSACAQDYYFCAAGAASDDCPATWGQCAAACDAPNLRAVPAQN